MAGPETIELEEGRRKEIDGLTARLKSSNYFELLGVSPGAPTEAVRKAFFEMSRKFHPDRYFGKKLGPYAHHVDQIFKRLTEAHSTLTDPDKRKAYLDANPSLRAMAAAAEAPIKAKNEEEERRDAERRARFARHPYLAKANKTQEHVHRARQHIEKHEYSQAFTQLNLASQMDPSSAEVKAMLVEVRKKNDEQRSESEYQRALTALEAGDQTTAFNSLKSAVAANGKHAQAAIRLANLLSEQGADPKERVSYAQKAVDADPKNADYRFVLSHCLDAAGMKALAKRAFEEGAKLNPEHPDVKKQAKRRWPF